MTLSSSCSHSQTGAGDYSGSLIANNYILRAGKNGIIFENNHHGTSGSHETVRDNIINTTAAGSAIKIACDNTTASSSIAFIDFYNNIIINSNTGGGGAAIKLAQGNAACTVDNLNFYNNTIYGSGTGILQGDTQYTNNIFRNNLISSGSVKAVDWPNATASNKFEYNYVQTSANPAITWLNTNRACAALSSAGTGNVNGCANPNFIDPAIGDLHIDSFLTGTLSGTLDAGTTSLTARTTSINNTVAEQYGLPDYSNAFPIGGSGVDIGATELMVTNGGLESGAVDGGWSKVPDPCDCVQIAASSAQSHTGTYSILVDALAVCDPFISCDAAKLTLTNLTIGTVYRVEMYIYAPISDPPGLFIDSTANTNYCSYGTSGVVGNGCYIFSFPTSDSTFLNSWQFISSVFQAEATTHHLYFTGISPGWTFYVDDVTVRPN
jgi:hypothetical protein